MKRLQQRYRSDGEDLDFTYDFLDKIYEKTIMNKIISKLVDNTIPNTLIFNVEDDNNNSIPEAEKIIKPISKKITRNLLKQLLRNYFLYGTGVLFQSTPKNGDIELMSLHPKYLDPYIDSKGVLKYYNYDDGYRTYKLPKDLVHILAKDARPNELFGKSILHYTARTLTNLLNNQLDLTEILNRYAIPMIQWAIDLEGVQTQDSDDIINKIKENLAEDLDAGDDIVSDARLTPNIIEPQQASTSLVQILDATRKDLSTLTIPQALIGGDADNLSASKVQISVFYQEINSYRATLNDFLVEELLRGLLPEEYKYSNVFLSFPLLNFELPSESIIWVSKALELGLITFDEGRSALGYKGRAPLITDELIDYYALKSNNYFTNPLYNDMLPQDDKQVTPPNSKYDPDSDQSRPNPNNPDGKSPDDAKLEPKIRDGRDPDNKRN